jgi:rubredoxin
LKQILREKKGLFFMKKYQCSICGYIYDEEKGCPDQGIAPGTKWEAVPDDFVCPECGVGKEMFELLE